MKLSFITAITALATAILSLVGMLFYTHKKRPSGRVMSFRELLDDNDVDFNL